MDEENIVEVDPAIIWFSQRSAGGSSRAQQIRLSIQENGFIFEPSNPVIIVRDGNTLTTLDNTRVAIAQELGLSSIRVSIKELDDVLPQTMIAIKRFGTSKTWGEALAFRTSKQRPPLRSNGTPERPFMPSGD